jgi:hypothetical protein
METLTKSVKETKTHWKKNFNYDYMGSYSLPIGQELVVTIKETKKEKVVGQSGKKEECFVCYFTDSDKPMILNRTNCKIISKIYNTPFIEEWRGKKIQLYSAQVNAFGETTDALRVRDFIPVTKVDNTEALILIKSSQTLEQLRDNYTSLPKALQGDSEVLKLKDTLKTILVNENI